jgi:hypothetical protein
MSRMWHDHIVGPYGARPITISTQVKLWWNSASVTSVGRGTLGSCLGNSRSLGLASAERPLGCGADHWHRICHAERLGCTSLDGRELNYAADYDEMPTTVDDR